MSNIMCRSPYWISDTFLIEPSTAQSAKLNLTIGGTLRYELIKNETTVAYWEVAELIRDYINWQYDNLNSHFVTVEYIIRWYSGENATGSIEQTGSTISGLFGTEGYGYFIEGRNPTHTRGYLQSNDIIYKPKNATIKIPIDTENASLVFFRGFNYAGGREYSYPTDKKIEYCSSYVHGLEGFDSFEQRVYKDGGTIEIGTESCYECLLAKRDFTDLDSVQINTTDGVRFVEVKAMTDSKFEPLKLTFINRWGAEQDVWFFRRSTQSISTKKEDYDSSIGGYNGNYDPSDHVMQVFEVDVKKDYELNTGFVDESYNVVMQELMQSEKVWLTEGNYTYPVLVDTNSLRFKTSVNDRLVDYTIKVTLSNNEINNIR